MHQNNAKWCATRENPEHSSLRSPGSGGQKGVKHVLLFEGLHDGEGRQKCGSRQDDEDDRQGHVGVVGIGRIEGTHLVRHSNPRV